MDKKERKKLWYEANKERILANQKVYYQKNKKRINERGRAYWSANKAKLKAWQKENHLQKTYAISSEDRRRLLAKQNDLCAICECDESQSGGQNPGIFHVDHSKVSGHIRGLLCNRCNLGIGHFFNDVYFLKRAVEYLERTN